MPSERRRLRSWTLVGLLLLAGCGGGQPKHADGARGSRTAPVTTTGGGRLVDIGGGRSLYLACAGTGSPTVVLEAGFGGASYSWNAVQPRLARTTRTCAYDRAGLGSSLPVPGVHDAGDAIADLARLLGHAHIPPPYVLVGHSEGGLLVRLFARAHPGETEGLVLVDAVGRNQSRRLRAVWRGFPARVRHRVPDPGNDPIVDGVDIGAGDALGSRITTLGDTPLVVITRGRLDEDGAPPLPPGPRERVNRLWSTMQDELAALSSDHVHVIARRSGHDIQHPVDGQPGVVVAGVRAVVRAARTGGRLEPCVRIFHGSGVSCRP